MEDLSVRPELCESGPSKFEWTLAFIVLIVPFVSFFYADTAAFLMYEIKFAEGILHGDILMPYRDVVRVKSAMGWEISSLSVYDLPLNLVFGIWGIPLYLWCSRSGELVINFPESFLQMLYGKSVLLIAFIFSALLVYKICRAININSQKSRWGAYIYFTSAMSISVIGVVGQCDIFCVCLTLLGLLAYIKNDNKKFLFWFIIAIQFKQFAFFVFMPLLLLREKNLLKIAGKLFLLAVVMLLCNLPLMLVSESAKKRAGFTLGMLERLLYNRLPFFHGNLRVFIILFGALCIYCWLHEYKDSQDRDSINHHIIFTAMLSFIIFFTSFPSYPYWFMHMIPYLAIMSIYNRIDSRKFLLFESLSIAAVIFSNYCVYYWCYTPNNAINMLLHKLTGSPDLINVVAIVKNESYTVTNKAINFIVKLFKTQSIFNSIYFVCIWTCAWLALPRKVSNYTNLCYAQIII